MNENPKNNKNVSNYIFGEGSIKKLKNLVKSKIIDKDSYIIYFFDQYFKKNQLERYLYLNNKNKIYYLNTKNEPTIELVNNLLKKIKNSISYNPVAIVSIGGGITLDIGKSISTLLTNNGVAEDYVGWDLIKSPGIYKIGIPTISGTGAESTRTCVLIDNKKNIKLGMNSDYSVFDQIILDPNLTKTVTKNQFFYTGMDTFFHSFESINGTFRNELSDVLSEKSIELCKEIFLSNNMQNKKNRSKMMVASYLGGCAISSTYLGLIHPFSAALGVVLGTHHGMANCIVMCQMKDFYPKEYNEFKQFIIKQKISIPKNVCKNLNVNQFNKLYHSMIMHKKPLINALGINYKKILTKKRVIKIFTLM